MASMIISDESMVLTAADFPEYFVDKHHPDDFKPVREPFNELIYHERTGHNRIILRMTVRLAEEYYTPFTFVCDTGAPNSVYLNEVTRKIIKSRINKDHMKTEYINVGSRKFTVLATPQPHDDCNVLGIRTLFAFGLVMRQDETFEFTNLPEYF